MWPRCSSHHLFAIESWHLNQKVLICLSQNFSLSWHFYSSPPFSFFKIVFISRPWSYRLRDTIYQIKTMINWMENIVYSLIVLTEMWCHQMTYSISKCGLKCDIVHFRRNRMWIYHAIDVCAFILQLFSQKSMIM